MKLFGVSFLLLEMALFVALPADSSGPAIGREVVAPYVQIDTPDGHIGSGVFLKVGGERLVLTCAHVVEGVAVRTGRIVKYRPLTVRKGLNGKDSYSSQADVVQVGDSDTGVDLALIRPRNVGWYPAIPQPARWDVAVTPEIGEDCWYTGTPGGIHARLERSIISQVGVKAPPVEGTFYGVNGCVYFGSSGGPVFVKRDSHYYLCGIVSRGGADFRSNPKCIGYCVDLPTIRAFLEAYTAPPARESRPVQARSEKSRNLFPLLPVGK